MHLDLAVLYCMYKALFFLIFQKKCQSGHFPSKGHVKPDPFFSALLICRMSTRFSLLVGSIQLFFFLGQTAHLKSRFGRPLDVGQRRGVQPSSSTSILGVVCFVSLFVVLCDYFSSWSGAKGILSYYLFLFLFPRNTHTNKQRHH
jgi:hypothetical protein